MIKFVHALFACAVKAMIAKNTAVKPPQNSLLVIATYSSNYSLSKKYSPKTMYFHIKNFKYINKLAVPVFRSSELFK